MKGRMSIKHSYMKQKLLLAALALGCASTMSATDVDFSYNADGEDPELVGWKTTGTYDNAIKIADPIYVGSRIKGFDVIVPLTGDISKVASGICGWMSTELKVQNDVNVPDLEVKDATINNQVLSVTFDTPQEIPEGGLWVGYSFKILNLSQNYGYPSYPVAVIESSENLDYGWWMHLSGWNEWANTAEANGYVNSMIVHLDTDFGDHDAAITLPEEIYLAQNEAGNVTAKITNVGASTITDIEYTVQIGNGTAETKTAHLSNPIPAGGVSSTIDIAVPAQSAVGSVPMTVTLTKTNGETNTFARNSATTSLRVLSFLPVKRPLVEEYTGLKCPYCPYGYVAMETLKDTYGDRFVGTAYHSSSYETGCMVTVNNNDFPVYISGFPAGDIDRDPSVHAANLPSEYVKYLDKPTLADLTADIAWTDDTKKEITIKTDIKFATSMEGANYRVAFCLVGDGLKNDAWKQSNGIAGYSVSQLNQEVFESEYWGLFSGKGSSVAGLTFNDVVCYFKDIKGISGIIPATIADNTPYSHEYKIATADVRNNRGLDFINTGAKVYGVVMIIDKNDKIVNCNRSAEGLEWKNTDSGIDAASIDAVQPVSTRWYNLQGAEVKAPAAGIYVKSEKMSDGTVRNTKTVVK